MTRGRWRRRARPDVALANDRRFTDAGSVEAMASHLQSVRVSKVREAMGSMLSDGRWLWEFMILPSMILRKFVILLCLVRSSLF